MKTSVKQNGFKIAHFILGLGLILLGGFGPAPKAITDNALSFNDKARQRLIPVEIYEAFPRALGSNIIHRSVAIICPGSGAKNTDYSFLAQALAQEGYVVVSIQLELPQDPPLATTGNLYQLRKPVWEQGVKTINFVIQELHERYADLNLNKVTLIGHSNGGDIVMLYAAKYPKSVANIIDLDSLRMPFPRAGKIPILSFRAVDTQADVGVIPHERLLNKYQITLIEMKQAKHIDMMDSGPEPIKQEIIRTVLSFLRSHS